MNDFILTAAISQCDVHRTYGKREKQTKKPDRDFKKTCKGHTYKGYIYLKRTVLKGTRKCKDFLQTYYVNHFFDLARISDNSLLKLCFAISARCLFSS